MVFSSHIFLFYFLPLVLALYYAWGNPRYRLGLLAVASYGFYAWANPPWALIMFGSTLVDYFCGLGLIRMSGIRRLPGGRWPAIPAGTPRTRGMLTIVVLSVTANLMCLGFFKYYNFTEENLNRVAEALGGAPWLPVLSVVLPVGVSFYTFKSMSYCIDVYRGEAPPMSNFVDFNAFEALFPDLVAGPIIRYGAIESQMRHRTLSAEKFARGVAFFACGMAKKILLANPMGHIADAAFGARELTAPDAWVGAVAYAFQIYFDFSGYSDMAIGLGLMLGFLFINNFDSPYHAASITEFWRRWHISLSTWLRDYLYIPLGGNRRGEARTYLNLMIVMLLGGLWHGASWNFVIWGGIHGVMLAVERAQGKDSLYRRLPHPVRVAVTFAVVCISWVFFRAATLPAAERYVLAMFAGGGDQGVSTDVLRGVMYTPYHLAMLAAAAVVVWSAPQTWQFTRDLSRSRAALCYGLLVASVMVMWTQTSNPFLYFQF
jgi:alginate O-acetyltransferase complex protein AlgI